MNKEKTYQLIVIGSGAAGMMAAIVAAKKGHKVLLLEKLSHLGAKLKATGGGKCNLTNTLKIETFMEHFGKQGRFMTPALNHFDQNDLRAFFETLGVESHSPDGFRVFPRTHNAETILTALKKELEHLGIHISCNTSADKILIDDKGILSGVKTNQADFYAPHIIIATGGLGYSRLGSTGDGYALAKALGHTNTALYPAMIPLHTKETWVAECRADTIPKVRMRIMIKKAKHLRANGDLIFTKKGIRGPVVLDFAREITPLLEKQTEVPILINLTQGKNEEQIRHHLKKNAHTFPEHTIMIQLTSLVPEALGLQLCHLCDIDPLHTYASLSGKKRDSLIKILADTPLTITGHDGFEKAMITRGGISLKEVNPDTLESKIVPGLYFCGEVLDLDGPCGGYNLQWSFASGHLSGHLGKI